MAQIGKLPIAHLIHPEKVAPHSTTLLEILEHGTRDRVAMTFLDRKGTEWHRTFGDLQEGARITATYLKNRGLKPGDKVIMLLLTGEQFVDAFFGTIMAGGVPVAVSPPMTFGDINKYLDNLSHIVRNSQARFMISFPRIRKVIGRVLAGDNDLEEFIVAKDIVAERAKKPGFPSIDPKDTAFIQYTSGSTGMPKGAMLSHMALLANIDGITHGIELTDKDVSVSWLPLFHDMGLIGSLLSALYRKTHLYTMQPEAFVMDPVSWLKYITKYKATIATAPNFAYHLLASRVKPEELLELDLSTLRVAFNGAEPVDLKTLDKFEKIFGPVGYKPTTSFPVYGMAENCLAATFPPLSTRYHVQPLDRNKLEAEQKVIPAHDNDEFPYLAISVGAPILGQQVAIKSEGSGFARQKQVGEILIKSPSLMTGYYRNPEATDEVIKDGWLYTGDLGFIDDGKLFVTGRAKEMIIKRGRNYYPYDIERAASSVHGVRKGCLVAFSTSGQNNGTEDLVIVAETRETDDGRKDKISKDIASEVLSSVGVRPDKVFLVPPRSIPKTSSGKLQRLLTKRRFTEGTLVKGMSERWFAPVKTLVGSFIGNQRFRLRVR